MGSSALTLASSMPAFVSWAVYQRMDTISRIFPGRLFVFLRKAQNPHRVLGAICYKQSRSFNYPRTVAIRALVLYLYCTFEAIRVMPDWPLKGRKRRTHNKRSRHRELPSNAEMSSSYTQTLMVIALLMATAFGPSNICLVC